MCSSRLGPVHMPVSSAFFGAPEPVARVTHLEALLQNPPQLLRLRIARILNLQIPTLGDNLLGGEGPLGLPPSRVVPPLLDLVHLAGEDFVLGGGVHGRVLHVVGGHVTVLTVPEL